MAARRKAVAIGICAVVALALTGCGADAPPKPTQYIGQTLEAANHHLNAPNVVDLAPKIVDKAGTYDAASDPSAWIVVAGCYASNPQKIATVGVLATTAMTDAIRRSAKNGEYNKYLVCKAFK